MTETFTIYRQKIIENCREVILGKDETILLVLISFICRGHVLLEDLPGTGKTMLLRSFAKSVGGDFKRIQFTPDLLPSDVTGINFYNQKLSDFEFRPGPLFANIILADEINRATPRTQSSLLEAMEEGQITVDGDTKMLDSPFMVMATQNPLESYGTFPLPEAQIDRFFMRLSLGYMSREQEIEVLSRPTSAVQIIEGLKQVVNVEETAFVQENFRQISVSKDVTAYIMDIIEGTRNESRFITGVSTRGAINLYKASQAYAALEGRSYCIPEDVQFVAPHVLAHRLGAGDNTLLDQIIKKATVPLEEV